MQPSAPVKRHWAFAVPYFTTTLADAAALNKRLIAELDASRASHVYTHLHENRYENTYAGLDQVPSVKPIFDIAEPVVSQIMGRPVVIPKEAEPGKVPWFWFNETKTRGGFTSLHNHWSPWTLFSGCYYIKVPPKSGNLVFSRRRSQTVAGGEVVLRDVDFFGDVELPITEGLLILFPSWLEHFVLPNETDESRISLAFNLRVPDGDKAIFKTNVIIDM